MDNEKSEYDNIKSANAPIQQRKCINCIFFDSRTAFCRKSPPQVVVNAQGFYVAMFPKISMPLLDFCYEHKAIAESQKETLLG